VCYRYVVSEGTDSTEIQVMTSCDPILSTGTECWHALMIPAASIPARDCFAIKRVGLQASTGRIQKTTSCDPRSACVQSVATTIFGQGERKFNPCHFPFPGAKVPRHFCSRERKFQVTKVPPIELSLPGAKVRGNEGSRW